MVFRVKICGVTNTQDALDAIDAGADAIGLNFFPGSRRYVDQATAQQIIAAIPKETTSVGVFVNSAADEIHRIRATANLHFVQLHGTEPPEFLSELGNRVQVVRARRLDERGINAIFDDLAACRTVTGSPPAAVLVDAAAPGHYGGSGVTSDWRQLIDYKLWSGGIPLILAGGLKPENVAEAIRIVKPHAVDVASGVESSIGKKDRAKMRDFVAAARAALLE